MPPVGRATTITARAQHALIEPVYQLSILLALVVFLLPLLLRRLPLEIWVDQLVVGVEVSHIDDQVLDDEHASQGRNHALLVILGNVCDAGKMVPAVAVHGAGSADALPARSSEGECGVDLVLDFDEGVEVHGPCLLHVDVVGHVVGPVFGVSGVHSVDVKPLQVFLLGLAKSLGIFLGEVSLKKIWEIGELGYLSSEGLLRKSQ